MTSTVPPNGKEQSDDGRTIYLPLPAMEECFSCHKSSREVELRVCKACGEATYCSRECQTTDWKAHKVQCGKTDRIDLRSFYPFLAYLAELSRYIPAVERHPALTHYITNNPQCVELPDGSSSRLVVLGPKMPDSIAPPSQAWWPAGPSHTARCRLAQRIVNERLLLPNLLSICIALVSEMYTTTALGTDVPDPAIVQLSGRRRVRMSHEQSPIVDFGIDHGTAKVSRENTLAYYSSETDEIFKGRDPEDHYRIYFKTLAGHDYYLDLGMFTFFLDILVDATPYCKKDYLLKLDHVPAFLPKRDFLNLRLGDMDFKLRKRTSILRDPRVHAILRPMDVEIVFFNKEDEPVIFDIMDEIAGRRCGEYERKIMMEMLPIDIEYMQGNVRDRDYVNFPKDPLTVVRAEADGSHHLADDAAAQKELMEFLEKQAKKLKKGKISREQWKEKVISARDSMRSS